MPLQSQLNSGGEHTPRLLTALSRPIAATLLILLFLAATWLYLESERGLPQAGANIASIGDGTGLDVAFSLVNHRGQAVSVSDFRGAPLLVVFGYTGCPDVCPMTLARLAEVLDDLESEGLEAQGVFITVDPNRDTPEVLAGYVEAFHERLTGLTGDEQSLRQATQSFRVFYQKVGESPDDYLMDHSAYIYLLGPDGDLLSYYHPDIESEVLLVDARGRLGQQN